MQFCFKSKLSSCPISGTLMPQDVMEQCKGIVNTDALQSVHTWIVSNSYSVKQDPEFRTPGGSAIPFLSQRSGR